jgi:hypothetical protein
MKTFLLKVIAALVFVCLLLNFTPALLKDTSLAWINVDSLSLRRNFYFGKGQLLADARTVLAGIRYLYQSGLASPTNPGNSVSSPRLPPAQPGTSTNLLAIGGAKLTNPDPRKKPSTTESLTVRRRLLSSYGLLPSFAFADSSSNRPGGLPCSNWEMTNHFIKVRTRSLQRTTWRCNAAAAGLRNSPRVAPATI